MDIERCRRTHVRQIGTCVHLCATNKAALPEGHPLPVMDNGATLQIAC